jgi:hypothetical protein
MANIISLPMNKIIVNPDGSYTVIGNFTAYGATTTSNAWHPTINPTISDYTATTPTSNAWYTAINPSITDYTVTTPIYQDHVYIPTDDWCNTYSSTTLHISTERFCCYATSEGRIREDKKELIFQLIEKTKMDYTKLVKHLAIEERLFNTLLLEYALTKRTKLYMELVSRNSHFSKYDLYNEVVKMF